MDRIRLKFFLTLSLFVGWVIALGAMALFSADQPRPLPRHDLHRLHVDTVPTSNFGQSKDESLMAWSWTPDRRFDSELMDAPGLPEGEVQDAYRVLRRVNRQLGNLRTIRREFFRFVREGIVDPFNITVLDVGSGSGDIPEAIGRMLPESSIHVLALDRDHTAVASARCRSLSVVQGDALRLPFADRTIDFVIAVKFAHHFHGPSLDQLLGEMVRVARWRVVILDIRRHWLAYWGFRAWSLIFTRNRLVRHDGPLSVLRGFTAEEMRAIAAKFVQVDWTIRSYLGFQIALVGQRVDTARDRVAQ